MATTVAIAVAKARRDVVSHFLSRNAVTPAAAAPYRPDRALRRREFAQLTDAGVLKPGDGGGWYLDAPAWDAYSRRLRRRAGIGVAAGLAVAGALVALFA